MKRSSSAIAASVLVAVLVSMLGSHAASATAASETCWKVRDAERRFATKINSARSAIDENKLRLDPELSRVARRHTAEMLAQGAPYHSPDRVLGRRVTNWRLLSENVGEGPTVRSTFRAFMGDAAHRYNIEHPAFTYMGVGVERDSHDRVWVTLVFESRSDPGTRLEMPDC